MKIPVTIMQLPHGQALPLPEYATHQSAGMDLMAAIEEALVFAPGERKLVPAGIAIGLPEGYEAQIRPRSGLALKHGMTVANAPGTIDADYRGEINVLLINLGDAPFAVTPGMRIAQMVVAPVSQVTWQKVAALETSVRGEGGFGSTGLHKKIAG